MIQDLRFFGGTFRLYFKLACTYTCFGRSIGLGFLRKTYGQSRWDVTSFCMQLKNLTRETKLSGKERVLPWYKGERREKGKSHFGSVHTFLDVIGLGPSVKTTALKC